MKINNLNFEMLSKLEIKEYNDFNLSFNNLDIEISSTDDKNEVYNKITSKINKVFKLSEEKNYILGIKNIKKYDNKVSLNLTIVQKIDF